MENPFQPDQKSGPKLSKLKELTFGERLKIMISFWAMLFGPFYYLYMGMWRKAITYTVLGYGVVFLLLFIMEMIGMDSNIGAKGLGSGLAAFFGMRVYICYYQKMVLNDNGWWW